MDFSVCLSIFHGVWRAHRNGLPCRERHACHAFAITDLGYKKIAKTLKLSCSMVAKTIQWFNWTGSTQNRPSHG